MLLKCGVASPDMNQNHLGLFSNDAAYLKSFFNKVRLAMQKHFFIIFDKVIIDKAC